MEKLKPEICYHPELMPTTWNQPRPEPCEMILTCECGANQICPVCGWGHCSYPCPCMIKYMKYSYPIETNEVPNESDDDEVTHEVFLGENVKRIIKTLKRNKKS